MTPRPLTAGQISRIRWRHEDCDSSACVATMEQGCEPTILLATIDAVRAAAPDTEGLDVERLARAIQAEDLNRGYRARSGRVYRDQARFIAREYAAPEAKP